MSKEYKNSLTPIEDQEKWYYDANMLDLEDTYSAIANHQRDFKQFAIFSHLSIGEALCNCHHKHPREYNAFLHLLSNLLKIVHVVNHDDIDHELSEVRNTFGELKLADYIHLA